MSATISADDRWPLLIDADDAIEALEDMIGGGEEDRGHDGLITDIIRLLKHYKAKEETGPDLTST